MKNIILIAAAALAMTFLSGCADFFEPTIDASSEEALIKSVGNITKDMPESEQSEITGALDKIINKIYMDNKKNESYASMSTAERAKHDSKQLSDYIDGKTAHEVVSLAKEF